MFNLAALKDESGPRPRRASEIFSQEDQKDRRADWRNDVRLLRRPFADPYRATQPTNQLCAKKFSPSALLIFL
jgi:hypothetical protein